MTQPCVKDLIELVDTIAPFDLAESWDNSGLQAGDLSWPVQRILVSLDVTPAVMAAAMEKQCNMVISHHPLVMTPEKSIDFGRLPGAVIYTAARENIAVVSAHTNLDKARDGLNDYFALVAGIRCDRPFYLDSDSSEDPSVGIGRLGKTERRISLKQLADDLKKRFNIQNLRVAGNLDLEVRSVALCTGSGGSLTGHFLKSGADVYITGDLKYHEAREIEAAGKAVVDMGHFASEHIVVKLLKKQLDRKLKSLGFEIEIYEYDREKDPFKIV